MFFVVGLFMLFNNLSFAFNCVSLQNDLDDIKML